MKLDVRVRRSLEVIVIVVVATLAIGFEGSLKEGQGTTPGFSSGSWAGSPSPDTTYKFGIIDASTGIISDLCAFASAVDPDFPGAAAALSTTGSTVHTFWFLTSNYMATNTCGFSYTPYQWGEQQANWFLYYIGLTGYSPVVIQMIGDAERLGVTCSTDLARWECDSFANNRQVIKGFQETIATARHQNFNGVYTSQGEWPEIVGTNVGPSLVATSTMWMASYGPTQTQLNSQAQYFDDLGYKIWSWQYADDTCQMTYADARSKALNASVYIARFDKWTNSQPNNVC